MACLSKHCSEEKWVELKQKKHDEISIKAEQKITQREIDKKVAANELHTKVYGKGLKLLDKLLDMGVEELKSLKPGKKIKIATPHNLNLIMQAIANAQKGQRLALNIDDKDVFKDVEPEIAIIQGIQV